MAVPEVILSYPIPVPVTESGPVSVPIPVAIPQSNLVPGAIPILESGLVPVSVAISIPPGIVNRRAHGLPEIRKPGLPRGPFAGMRRRGRRLGDRVADLPPLVAMAHPGSTVGVPAHAASGPAPVVISPVAPGTCPASSLSAPVAFAAAVAATTVPTTATTVSPTPAATALGVRDPGAEAPERGVPVGQERHKRDGQEGDRCPCQYPPHGVSSSMTGFPAR
jgi:hypothetical protein